MMQVHGDLQAVQQQSHLPRAALPVAFQMSAYAVSPAPCMNCSSDRTVCGGFIGNPSGSLLTLLPFGSHQHSVLWQLNQLDGCLASAPVTHNPGVKGAMPRL